MTNRNQTVILVDDQDRPLGQMEKIEAHRKGLLHRAFSILVFNSRAEMLLQRRAPGKYHCPGLWTNACCSHQQPEEEAEHTARKRLAYEMGIDIPLEEKFSFIYRADFENGLSEHEYDHVYFGYSDGPVLVHPEEADSWRWVDCASLAKEMREHPEEFTPWFRIIFEKAVENRLIG